jgi:hypothetical protein
LTAIGIGGLAHDVADHRHQPGLDRGGVLAGVAADRVDVELEGVGAGVGDQLGVVQPAVVGDAVERRDHRHRDRALHLGETRISAI